MPSSIPGDSTGAFVQSIYQSPQWAAWLRSVNNAKSEAGTARRDAIQTADRAYAALVPSIQYQGERAATKTAGSFGARNLFRSGLHEQAQADVKANTAAQLSQAEINRAEAVSAAEQNWADTIASLDMQSSEKALDLETQFIQAGLMAAPGDTAAGAGTGAAAGSSINGSWAGEAARNNTNPNPNGYPYGGDPGYGYSSPTLNYNPVLSPQEQALLNKKRTGGGGRLATVR